MSRTGKVPTVAQVVEMHDRILAETGGTEGILWIGALESAVVRAASGPFPGAATPAVRAALLLRGICQDHPFADGNKRTALEAADVLLRGYGMRLAGPASQRTRFILSVAQGQFSFEAIAAWIVTHAQPLNGRDGKGGT